MEKSDKNEVRDEEQKATAEIIRMKENVNLPEIMQRMIAMFEYFSLTDT